MAKKRFKVAKLVRDNMERYMLAKGVQGPYITLEKQAYLKELKTKLLEKAHEVITATNDHDVQKELADLLKVIHALHHFYNLDLANTESIRLEKHKQLGGLQKGLYVPYADIDEHNPFIQHYFLQPEKYPEMPIEE